MVQTIFSDNAPNPFPNLPVRAPPGLPGCREPLLVGRRAAPESLLLRAAGLPIAACVRALHDGHA
jgi:hypothetical protein